MRPDTPLSAVVAAARAGRLVGLVDEHHHLSERVQHGEDLLEVALGGAQPLVAEVLEHHAGDADLARPAHGEVRLAGADAPGQQVAHGQRLGLAAPEQLGVLAQPGLRLLVPADVVQRTARLDELEEPEALLLDQLALRAGQVVAVDLLAVLHRQRHQVAQIDPRQTDGALRQGIRRQLRQRRERWQLACQRLQISVRLVARGQVDLDLGDVRRLDDQPVEVAQVLGDQYDGDVGAQDGRIGGPIEQADDRLRRSPTRAGSPRPAAPRTRRAPPRSRYGGAPGRPSRRARRGGGVRRAGSGRAARGPGGGPWASTSGTVA